MQRPNSEIPPERYPLSILVESDRPLRKPRSGGSKRFRAELEAFRSEAQDQVQRLRRAPLPGDVAVSIDLHVPGGRQQPLLPTMIKAYLDALQGIGYGDDRRVAHLLVRRYGLDHPSMNGFEDRMSEEERQRELDRPTTFFAEIMDLDDYVGRFDRAFKVTKFDRRHTPWWGSWSYDNQVEVGRLKGKRLALRMSGQRIPPELDEYIRLLDEDFRLGSTSLAAHDRPGPPVFVPAFAQFLWAARKLSHSSILLPLPSQRKGTSGPWQDSVRSAFRAMARAGTPFKRQVALDIAVRGTMPSGKDLDNLAHSILVPFEEEMCAQPGTVSCYRAYRAQGQPGGVQIRLTTESVMLALEGTIGRAAGRAAVSTRRQAPNG